MNTGEKIKALRCSRNMTQEQLASAAGISINTLKKYEYGDRNPKPDQIDKLCEALNVSKNVFLNFEINTVSDLLAILFEIDSQIGINVDADKNNEGGFISDTVKVHFQNTPVDMKLCAYLQAMERINAGNADVDIEDYKISLLDDMTPLAKNPHNSPTPKATSERTAEKPLTDEFYELLFDCTSYERDFILTMARHTKETLRKK